MEGKLRETIKPYRNTRYTGAQTFWYGQLKQIPSVEPGRMLSDEKVL